MEYHCVECHCGTDMCVRLAESLMSSTILWIQIFGNISPLLVIVVM